jgi:hypothetical protein
MRQEPEELWIRTAQGYQQDTDKHIVKGKNKEISKFKSDLEDISLCYWHCT